MTEPTPATVAGLCRELRAARRDHAKRKTYATLLKVQHTKRAVDLKAHAIRDTFKLIEGGSHPERSTRSVFLCPINYPGCTRNCGNYGCGN